MNKYLTHTFGLLILLSGCNDTDTLPTNGNALAIEVGIESIQSRAVISGISLPNASVIDVVLKNSISSEIGYGTNGTKRTFTLTNGKWVISTVLEVAQMAKVLAVYPSGLTSPVVNTNFTTLTPAHRSSLDLSTVTTANQTLGGKPVYIPDTEIDYLVGAGTAVSPTAIRSFINLQHAMSMVGVRLIKGNTYGGVASLTKLVVENKNNSGILCSGTVSIPDNDFSKGSTAVSYTRTLTYTAQSPSDAGIYIAFLAYPAILYQDGLAQLKLTVDGIERTLDLPGDEQGTLHWRAGNCILYDVMIHGKEITLQQVTVTPWDANANSNTNIEVQ